MVFNPFVTPLNSDNIAIGLLDQAAGKFTTPASGGGHSVARTPGSGLKHSTCKYDKDLFVCWGVCLFVCLFVCLCISISLNEADLCSVVLFKVQVVAKEINDNIVRVQNDILHSYDRLYPTSSTAYTLIAVLYW